VEVALDFRILAQPTITTCGPTCLEAVYAHFGDEVPLDQIIEEVHALEGGGTLAVFLACHALRRGYKARMFTNNLQVFDPSWFFSKGVDLADRLRLQASFKKSRRLHAATKGYLEYLKLGGQVFFEELNPALIRRFVKRGLPILTGLSATYLYNTPREYGPNCEYDDLRGEVSGHFVVLCGYDRESKQVLVADPLVPNPAYADHIYPVSIHRAINAILLGILTYDANLLIIEPPDPTRKVVHE
jgi:hypothetical protein